MEEERKLRSYEDVETEKSVMKDIPTEYIISYIDHSKQYVNTVVKM